MLIKIKKSQASCLAFFIKYIPKKKEHLGAPFYEIGFDAISAL